MDDAVFALAELAAAALIVALLAVPIYSSARRVAALNAQQAVEPLSGLPPGSIATVYTTVPVKAGNVTGTCLVYVSTQGGVEVEKC